MSLPYLSHNYEKYVIPGYGHAHLMVISSSQVELSACQNQLKQETAARARAEAQVLEVLSAVHVGL